MTTDFDMDEIFAPGELEAAVEQRIKDGFGYFMVMLTGTDDAGELYGRSVAVKARDAAHAREIPLEPGEGIESVDVDTKEMYDWHAPEAAHDLMTTTKED